MGKYLCYLLRLPWGIHSWDKETYKEIEREAEERVTKGEIEYDKAKERGEI